MPVDNDSEEGRALLAERDELMGKVLEEPDAKKRQAMQDRVDEVHKKLGQDAHYGKAAKAAKPRKASKAKAKSAPKPVEADDKS